jgi:hypothetical protein
MATKLIAVALGAFMAGSVVVPATANETGLAQALHSIRREAGKLCLADHFHYGSSYSQPSKKAAEIAAIQDWAGFTAFEYGTVWANFRKAASKKINCSQSGGGWSCSLEARPCK